MHGGSVGDGDLPGFVAGCAGEIGEVDQDGLGLNGPELPYGRGPGPGGCCCGTDVSGDAVGGPSEVVGQLGAGRRPGRGR